MMSVPVSAGEYYHESVLNFEWPTINGNAPGLYFYGVAMHAGTFDFIGDLQVLECEY